MSKAIYIFRWIVVTVFGIMAIGSIYSNSFLGGLMFLIGGAIIAPLDSIYKLRSRLKLNKPISIVLSVLFLFSGTLSMSNADKKSNVNPNSDIFQINSNISSNIVIGTTTSSEITYKISSEFEENSSAVTVTSKPKTSSYQKTTTSSIPDTVVETTTPEPDVQTDTIPNSAEETVYITKTGKKYHSRKNCSGLNNAKAIYDSTLSNAQNLGLTPCSKCH
jgi:hypothetical protein